MIKSKNIRQKYNFQVQSSRTKHWFDLDHEWLKENFMAREPYFYKKLYQTKFRGDDTQNHQRFGVPIGNSKMTKKLQFHPEAPLTQYHQK